MLNVERPAENPVGSGPGTNRAPQRSVQNFGALCTDSASRGKRGRSRQRGLEVGEKIMLEAACTDRNDWGSERHGHMPRLGLACFSRQGSWLFVLFFFVCSHSHATLLDYGGVLVNHFFPSAVPPRRAGSVAATRALRPGLSLHRELNPGSRG